MSQLLWLVCCGNTEVTFAQSQRIMAVNYTTIEMVAEKLKANIYFAPPLIHHGNEDQMKTSTVRYVSTYEKAPTYEQ
ncbi:hypothetical protein KUL17_14930 [Alteromonas sp. KUL17]|uniref:hypothetical protein n=1 Tax=Alteromonas sp. KUL17 TaxID=2480796 RepID=UPI0010FFB436|nr:hypothetical protein [Alteromonas sp. KUL17]GEA02596.1 hypothetical protein KUL17_14930 [Alteromonas sp. KUL17]